MKTNNVRLTPKVAEAVRGMIGGVMWQVTNDPYVVRKVSSSTFSRLLKLRLVNVHREDVDKYTYRTYITLTPEGERLAAELSLTGRPLIEILGEPAQSTPTGAVNMKATMRKTKVKRLGAGSYYVTGSSGQVYWIREVVRSEGFRSCPIWQIGIVRPNGTEEYAFDAGNTLREAKRFVI